MTRWMRASWSWSLALAACVVWTSSSAADLDRVWEARYNGPTDGNDEPAGVAVDAAGNVYVSGVSRGETGGYDMLTVRYGPDGREHWVARYDGPGQGTEHVAGVVVDAHGGLFVAGTSTSTRGADTELVTIRYEASTGDATWVARFDAARTDASAGGRSTPGCARPPCPPVRAQASGIALGARGRVHVVGAVEAPDTGYDYQTLTYAADGKLEWARRYGGPAGRGDHASAVAAGEDGRVLVTGRSRGERHFDIVTVAYDRDGEPMWTDRYDGPVGWFDAPDAVALAPDGALYVVGTSFASWRHTGIVLLRYERDGTRAWVRRYDPAEPLSAKAVALARDATGVYVVGTGRGPDDWDVLTLKYGPDGTLAWATHYADGGRHDDRPVGLALDGEGRLFVAATVGISHRVPCRQCPDIAVIGYDAGSGDPVWATRYDGPAGHIDAAAGIAASGRHVVVTGASVGTGGIWTGLGEPPRDFVTVKFVRRAVAPAR